jgi:hypothetical protein
MDEIRSFFRQGPKALSDTDPVVYQTCFEEIASGAFFFSGQCVKSSKSWALCFRGDLSPSKKG